MKINYFKLIIKFFVLINITKGSSNDNSDSSINLSNNNNKPKEWAVYLYDKKNGKYLTEEQVNKLAKQKDFINLGKIGELEGYWLFKMKEEEEEDDDDDDDNDDEYNDENDFIKEKYSYDQHIKKNKREDNNKLSNFLKLNKLNKNGKHKNIQHNIFYDNKKLKKKRRNNMIAKKKYKRTINEAEDDLLNLKDLHWFEQQKYVQRYKREFVPFNIINKLNDGIGKNNVYDYNAKERRKRFINSYKYDYSYNDDESNESLKKYISRGITYKDMYSEIVYDYDHLNFTDPFFYRQWHLYNNGTVSKHIGNDINVVPLWKRGINGTGVVVSVIDDGVEWTHDDLRPAWYTDKTRLPKTDSHGTRCAGTIAAQPNLSCGIGVAFGAKIAGERLISAKTTDSMEASAVNYKYQINDIYSNSWGPNDDGATLDGPGTLCNKALKNGVMKGRKGYGSIFIFASGNGGMYDDNCNFDGFANSIYTIAIGALAHDNSKPFYAEICSAQLAVTYSGDRKLAITTTDILNSSIDKNTRTKGCASDHTGTSAAAPIASGIIALMLSVRPDLGWRDIQHIIVNNAVVISPDDSGWAKNGAGHYVHHYFGFGKMDAEKLVDASIKHKILPISALKYSKEISPKSLIPIDEKPFESTIELTEEEVGSIHSLEHVQITVKLPHVNRRYLTIKLISPSGTESILATKRTHDEGKDGFNPWTFMTVFNWGESPIGIWKLIITDSRKSENPDNIKWSLGKLQSWKLTIHGLCDEKHIQHNEDKRPYCNIQLSNNESIFNFETLIQKKIVIPFMVSCIILCFFLLYLFNNKKCFIFFETSNLKYTPLENKSSSSYELTSLKETDGNNSKIQKSNSTEINKSNLLVRSCSSNYLANNHAHSVDILQNEEEDKDKINKNVALMRLKANNRGGLVKSWSLSNLQERKASLYSNNEDNSPVVDDKKFNFPRVPLSGGSSLKNNIERNTREMQQRSKSNLCEEISQNTSSFKNGSQKSNLRKSYSSRIIFDDNNDERDNNNNNKNNKKTNKLNKSKSSNNLKF
ncbi:hypothetical protein BCR32DRAFT_246305 [Anaeromyces robustus]|uniref:P/Homo B domain-containing protein n=1 Tax=Anaeromyces robustus TaxID=1754192 RepID=A0A1Y1X1M9_9FUNG|nr:hypothetical protein BCR32DRAFT_246305 [Anaeromyces robustus]|eukprot:ORX79528.1 hypothetical protein BCR32DRAFT_246305 [Anaeromyces robustus]